MAKIIYKLSNIHKNLHYTFLTNFCLNLYTTKVISNSCQSNSLLIYNYRFKSDAPMKQLRAIIEKNQQCSTRFIYVAQSCTNERMISGISFIDVKWNGLQNDFSYIAMEQKCLIQGTTAFSNISDEINHPDMERQISKQNRKYLINFQSHYYIMQFSTSEHDFTNVKKFLMRCFHVLVSRSHLNQINKSFTYFLQGMEENNKQFYPKITITLVNRCSAQLIPFLNKSQKNQALKSIKQKQKVQVTNQVEECKENPTSTSNNSVVTEIISKDDEAIISQDPSIPPHEQKQLDSLAKRMQIEIKSHALKSFLKLNATKLLQKQAAHQFREIRPQSSNNPIKVKKISKPRISQKKDVEQLSKHSQHNKSGLKILSHRIDDKNQWIFKVQTMKERSIQNQIDLIRLGYAEEVKQYKELVGVMNQIDEE